MTTIYKQFLQEHKNEILTIIQVLAYRYKFNVVDALEFINGKKPDKESKQRISKLNMIMEREAKERQQNVEDIISKMNRLKLFKKVD